LDLGFSGLLDLWFFLGSGIVCFSKGLGSLGFLDVWIFGVFQGIGSFCLLIQRCKRVREIGNFFDQGLVLPDESTQAPGEGYDRGKARDEALPKFW
jgi:hypothetical protein